MCLQADEVDTAGVGIYTVHYTAVDAAGNIGSANRTVVIGKSSISISLVYRTFCLLRYERICQCFHAVPQVTPSYMRTAQFDSTGSKINVVFDQALVFTLTTVECSAIFNDAARLLGAGAVCNFASPTSMQIVLSPGATLRQSVSAKAQKELFSSVEAQRNCRSKVLSLLEDSVKAAADESVSGAGCVRVAGPSNPQPPIAIVEFERRIGICDDLHVNAASSVAASGGRRLVFEWSVAFFNATMEIPVQVGFPALGNATSITIKKSDVPETATAIRVTLKLRSIFDTVTSKVMEVKRALAKLPSVDINSRSSVLKKNNFYVIATGGIPSCADGDNAGAPSLTYSWSVTSTATRDGETDDSQSSRREPLSSWMKQKLVRYTNKRESGLRFKAYALLSCTTYRFRCTVSYKSGDGSTVNNWDTREVVVKQGKIVAIISGRLLC